MTRDAHEIIRRARRRKRIAGWSLGGAVLLLAAGYVAVAAAERDTIPADTTISGVQVGGMSRDAAQHTLDAAFRRRAAQDLTITAGGKTLTLTPTQAGLTFDTSHALDGLTGFSLEPAALLRHFTGSDSTRKVATHVDRGALTAAVQPLARRVHTSPKNGKVTFTRGAVKITRSVPGKTLDSASLVRAVAAGWPAHRSFTATVTAHPAPLTNKEIDTFVTSFARPAMSGPLTVTAGTRHTTVTPEQLSAVLSAPVTDGSIAPKVDDARLRSMLDSISSELVTPPQNARVREVDGKQQVIDAKDGTALVTADAGSKLLAALTDSKRTVRLPTTPVQAAVTAADVRASLKNDKRELISQFVSNYPTGPQNAARTKNIAIALSRIDGTYVAPGQQFSLLAALTPITKANGYVDAPVLVNGVDVPGVGGGLSQVSTTMYNATFFAGLQEDEHTAHAYWISRYPMGREATLWVGRIDNKWTNDSGHGIWIRAGIEGHAAVIRLYGTKVFTVASTTGQPFNITAPKTRVLHTENCIEQPPVNGFDVTVTRVVRSTSSGKIVKNESLTTHYVPADRVICK